MAREAGFDDVGVDLDGPRSIVAGVDIGFLSDAYQDMQSVRQLGLRMVFSQALCSKRGAALLSSLGIPGMVFSVAGPNVAGGVQADMPVCLLAKCTDPIQPDWYGLAGHPLWVVGHGSRVGWHTYCEALVRGMRIVGVVEDVREMTPALMRRLVLFWDAERERRKACRHV